MARNLLYHTKAMAPMTLLTKPYLRDDEAEAGVSSIIP